jgi:serine protease Do
VTLDNASTLSSSSSTDGGNTQSYEYGMPGQSGEEQQDNGQGESKSGSASDDQQGSQPESNGNGFGFSFGG